MRLRAAQGRSVIMIESANQATWRNGVLTTMSNQRQAKKQRKIALERVKVASPSDNPATTNHRDRRVSSTRHKAQTPAQSNSPNNDSAPTFAPSTIPSG